MELTKITGEEFAERLLKGERLFKGIDVTTNGYDLGSHPRLKEYLIEQYGPEGAQRRNLRNQISIWNSMIVGVSFQGLYLNMAKFFATDASGVDFSGTDLQFGIFWKSNLHSAIFDEANILGAEFTTCNLTNADFRNVKDMRYSDFKGSDHGKALIDKTREAIFYHPPVGSSPYKAPAWAKGGE